jgi:hypothetical protein
MPVCLDLANRAARQAAGEQEQAEGLLILGKQESHTEHPWRPSRADGRDLVPPGHQRPAGKFHDRTDLLGDIWRKGSRGRRRATSRR